MGKKKGESATEGTRRGRGKEERENERQRGHLSSVAQAAGSKSPPWLASKLQALKPIFVACKLRQSKGVVALRLQLTIFSIVLCSGCCGGCASPASGASVEQNKCAIRCAAPEPSSGCLRSGSVLLWGLLHGLGRGHRGLSLKVHCSDCMRAADQCVTPAHSLS